MAKKNTLEKAPFREVWSFYDDEGNSLSERRLKEIRLETFVDDPEKVDWRPNTPFEAEMEFLTSSRGRSSTTFVWRDTATDVRYEMFVSSLDELLRKRDIVNSRTSGVWHIVKRGQNYGLELFEN